MIEYNEEWLWPLIFRWNGSVYYRAMWFAIPGCIFNVVLLSIDQYMPNLRHEMGVMSLSQSVIWGATTVVLVAMLGFRTRMGYARFWEGTGLLHQMKGEWFDTISNCVTFSISAKLKNPEKVIKFRHAIVRLMSLCHASALEEISGMDAELQTIDTHGLDYTTLLHLKNCVEVHGFNKVEVLLHLIQSLITKAHEEGVLSVPPPILSRVFQTCSRGYVNLLNTKKITDTKFPFPYVQLITLLLLLHTFFIPCVVSSIIDSHGAAVLVTFMALFGMHSINFIAIELEDPFGTDDNDLPLAHFQTEMNSCLLMLLHYDTDIIASTSPSCVFDFTKLKKSMMLTHHGPESQSLFSSGSDMLERLRGTWMPSESPEDVVRDSPERTSESRKSSRRLSDVVCSETLGFQPLGAVPGRISISDADIMHKIIGEQQEAEQQDSGAMSQCSSDAVESDRGENQRGPQDQPACLCRGDCTCKARAIPTTPEPKLVTTQDLSPFLVDSMDEFNRNLQAWSQMMEDQVRELSDSFGALNKLSSAAPTNCAIGLVRPNSSGDAFEPVAAAAASGALAPRGVSLPGRPPKPGRGGFHPAQQQQQQKQTGPRPQAQHGTVSSRGPSTSSTSSTVGNMNISPTRKTEPKLLLEDDASVEACYFQTTVAPAATAGPGEPRAAVGRL